MKNTYRLTVVRYGEETRRTIITCTREGLRTILKRHAARGVSVTVEEAHWVEVDNLLRRER